MALKPVEEIKQKLDIVRGRKYVLLALVSLVFIWATFLDYGLQHPRNFGQTDFAVFYAAGVVGSHLDNPYDQHILKKVIK